MTRDSNPTERPLGERIGQPVIVVIILDLLTFGIYSAIRSYYVHAALSKATGRRLFADAFLHVLMVLNVALLVLRFSRDAQPLDSTVILARLGTSLLFVTLLLVFRRCLHDHFHLRIRALPLALFGFWYLQYRMNRHRKLEKFATQAPTEGLWAGAAVALIYVSLGIVGSGIKHYDIATASMEPTLTVGDHVLVEAFIYPLTGKPKLTDLVAFTAPENQNQVSIKRVLGLPGDHLSFREKTITINDQALDCQASEPGNETAGLFDKSEKVVYDCRLSGKSFRVHYYRQGALTEVFGNFVIPADHYFLVGDNLDNSADSRALGPIPRQQMIGRVFATTFSYRPGVPIPWDRWLQPL